MNYKTMSAQAEGTDKMLVRKTFNGIKVRVCYESATCNVNFSVIEQEYFCVGWR